VRFVMKLISLEMIPASMIAAICLGVPAVSFERVVHACAHLIGSLRNLERTGRMFASIKACDSSSDPDAIVFRTPREER